MTQPRSDGPTDRPAGAPSGRTPAQSVSGRTKVVGNYDLKKKLGEGAVGQVWLAHDRVLDRDVALKFLRSSIAGDEAKAREFLKEARATARLNHPNIVTVHQAGKEAGRVFIAMEYVEGGSLADEVKTHGALPWREATQAIRDACAGLQVAHEAGLVHRDIKPSNLMRSRRRVVKVVDFGLARAEGGDPEATRTIAGAVLGSPGYMSPEQCRGQPADARSDLYSLTCSFYQLLTRQLPFGGDSLAGLIYQHCNEPFPDASMTMPALPDAVLRILAKGSAKNPAERYPSAAQMLAELESVLATPEVSLTFERKSSAKLTATQPLTFLKDIANPSSERRAPRKMIWVIASMSLLVLLAIIVRHRFFGRSAPNGLDRPQSDVAISGTADADKANHVSDVGARTLSAMPGTQPPSWAQTRPTGILREFPWPGDVPPLRVDLTPDLRRVMASKNRGILWDAESGKVVGSLPGEDAGWMGGVMRLLPDGKRLAVENDGSWTIRDVERGKQISHLADHLGFISSVAADGSRLLIYDPRVTSLALLDLNTGNPLLTMNMNVDVGRPILSPDGRMFAAAPMWSDFVLHAWDAHGGKELWHAEANGGCEKLVFSRDGNLLLRVAHAQNAFLHDSKTGQVVAECLGKEHASDGVLSSDSRFVILGYWNTPLGIGLFDLTQADSGTVTQTNWTPQTRGFGVNAIALSRDDHRLAVACRDNMLRIFEVPSGKLEYMLRHDSEVTCTNFSPDGQFVVSGEAKVVRLWRLPSPERAR